MKAPMLRLRREGKFLLRMGVFILFVISGLFADTQQAWSKDKTKVPIGIKQSFRYPIKKFIKPLVSPDDRWLVYHCTDIDWSEFTISGLLFGDVDDIVWKKIFYTEVGSSDKKAVPLPRLEEGQEYRTVGFYKKWSPDGRFLAFFVEIDSGDRSGGDYLVIVDFSGRQPQVVEKFKAYKSGSYVFLSSDEVLYIDEHRKCLLRKEIGREARKVIDFQESEKKWYSITDFQIASDGTIIYKCRRSGWSVYVSNLATPSQRALLFSNEKEPETPPEKPIRPSNVSKRPSFFPSDGDQLGERPKPPPSVYNRQGAAFEDNGIPAGLDFEAERQYRKPVPVQEDLIPPQSHKETPPLQVKNEIPIFKEEPIPSNFDISPDGRYAVYYFQKDGNHSTNRISLVNLGSVAVVDEFYIKWPTRARWSPDGTRLAYIEDTTVHEDPDDPSRRIWPNPRFFILDTMTMKKQDYGVGVTRDFNWTPDGEHIIHSMKYAHPTLGVYTLGIFIMRASDGNEIGRLSNVSATPGDSGTITPSGQYVYWQALNTDTFFVVKNPFFHEMTHNLE